MKKIKPGRFSAQISEEGVVVFLIGMRINSLWRLNQWLPVAVAMPKMVLELVKDPSIGLMSSPRTFISGRVIMVVQYWESFDKLEAYSRSADNQHLPAWRRFNRRVRDNGSVGIWHETYRVGAGGFETIYANMPVFGLALATEALPASQLGQTAGRRLGVRNNDETVVDPY